MLGLALFALTLSAVAAQEALKPSLIRRLDGSTITTKEAEAFARKTLEAAHVTGAQIVVFDQGGVVWSAAFGLRKRNPDLPMERDTTTWAASITKSLFATYVMLLVERGEFQLDVPVARQLPQALDTYEAYRETASALVQDPNWPKVTPRMLLAHTSGLANFTFVEPDKKMHLHFPPGTQYRYSGDGINLVQFLIEQQKRRSLDVLMQEALFTPLEMKQTGMIYRPEFASHVADRFNVEGKFIAETRRYPARGAGSMTTSAEDLGRFVCALLANKILTPESRKAMLTPAIQIRTLHQFPLKPNEPEGTEGPAVGLGYGVGWGLLTRTPFGPAFFKEGHGDGAQNYLICFEERKAGMILLTNSDNGELAFRPLLETILGNTVTPWEWEGYTPSFIAATRP